MEELLRRIRQKGISLWLEDGNIKYQAAKGVMTKELIAEITQNKQEIIDFLKQASYLKTADDKMEKAESGLSYYEVSYSQQSLWFFDKMNKGNALYNISNVFLVEGNLDNKNFTKAMNMTVSRHESLRTIFVEEENKPARRIIEKSDITMDFIDLSEVEPSIKWDRAREVMEEKAWKSFDLENGPLWRICLIRLKEEQQLIMLTIHHIIADAWSNRIFLLEIMKQYAAMKEKREGKFPREESLPSLEYDYSDFVNWQRKRFSKKAIMEPLLSYWKTKLSGYEPLMLMADYERPAIQSFSGKTATHFLSASLSERIRDICLKKDVTMFMYLLAGFEILLSRYSGQSDIILGTVVANRAREELRTMIGFIMNTIVIREDLSGDISISDLLKKVKKTTLDAYTYQELPFDLLLEELKPERFASRTPVFQVMYIHQSVESSLPNTDGLKLKEIPMKSKIAPFDIRLSTSETENGILCTLDYCDALYKSSTIQTFLSHYEQILKYMAENMEESLQTIPMLTQGEISHLIKDFNQTEVQFPFHTTIHQMFEERVVENKDKIALHLEGEEMSYGELNEKANKLARFLRERGVLNNVPVGVCLERSFEMFICLLGILKAGGAYIPIDTGYPKDRVSYMIQSAGASIFLTDQLHKEMLKQEGIDAIVVDNRESQLDGYLDSNLNIQVEKDDLAYIIYTSGSTGEPKGAMNTQIGFLNHKLWMKETFHINKEDVFLQKTPFSFDVSIWEIFLPLITGAKLVIAKPNGQKDPMYLAKLLLEQKITIVHFVPSMLRVFLEEPEIIKLHSLKRMFVSGEAMDYSLLVKTKEKFSIPVYNVYGPAECADVSTMWECDVNYKNHMVPIGKPISNMRVYILDKYKNPVALGVTGELYVAGIGVGKGYIHNDKLTKERYFKDKFVSYNGWMYKTGDLGKFLEDGNIAYMGRSDFQVKIRGMRIELGEIEKCVQSYKGIKNSAVVVWEKENHTKHLAVYFTENMENEIDKAALKKELSKHLPEYMVPNYYTKLTQLPLNPSGKLDRKALPEPESRSNTKKEFFSPPENEVQRKIAEIWMEVLEVDSVDIYDNFFEIGGHSLMLIQVYKKLKEVFLKEFSLIELFTYSTIEGIAQFITEDNEKNTLDTKRLDKQKEAKKDKEEKIERTAIMENEGIAIIGMSGRFPGARNIEEYWSNLKEGRDCITFFTPEDAKEAGVRKEDYTNKNYVCAGGLLEEIEYFEEEFFSMTPKEAANLDPQQRLFLECSYEALEDAGYAKEKYEEPVGVFAGANMSTYFLYHLADKIGMRDDFSVTVGNDKDYIATRTSYQFNLKGPSASVQSACSTSMTAVAMACDSLDNFQCDMAIAGGAAIKLPQKMGYLYQEGMIASKDGQTRPFDKEGTGTVFTSVVGAVVLKRLEDALKDRDNIYAVIKGIAVNNDGSDKVGFTAPSREGQANVIESAWYLADISTEDAGYIEAFGTGTKLGDPIEMSALSKAFEKNTKKKGYCGVGSVKGNIGHSVSGAGIAGLIKTALMIKYGEIPPSIHFSSPNEEIDFINSPFYVNTRLRKWERNGKLRTAGVNSYGFGGTNVHAVLQEVEEESRLRNARVSNPFFHLLTLSARTEKSLDQMRVNLGRFLRDHKNISFEDAVYTLHVGRKQFDYRLAIVCKDQKEAVEKLFDIECDEVLIGKFDKKTPIKPLEKEILDKAAKREEEALKIAAQYFVKGGRMDWESFHLGEHNFRISLPTYAFDKKRHWVEQFTLNKGNYKAEMEIEHADNWLYKMNWERKEFEKKIESNPIKGSEWLVFMDELGIGDEVCKYLVKEGGKVRKVYEGIEFKELNHCDYTIDCHKSEDYYKLIKEWSKKEVTTRYILHLFNVTKEENQLISFHEIEENMYRNFYSLLFLAQAIGQQKGNQKFKITTVTNHLHFISNERIVRPEKALILGPVKVIPKENPKIICQTIDLDMEENISLSHNKKTLIPSLIAEILPKKQEFLVAYRGPFRWVLKSEPVIQTIPSKESYKKDGVTYLITGGLGGIGFELAKHLAENKSINLILVGRSRREDNIEKIETLQNLGADVMYICGDCTKEDQMDEVFTKSIEKYGQLYGIFHAAGSVSTEELGNKTVESTGKVLSAKVKGTLILDKWIDKCHPKFVVLFSSISAVLGNAGLIDYNSANSFMDSYAWYRLLKEDTRVVSINWDGWDNLGIMAATSGEVNRKVKGNLPLSKGLELLDKIIDETISGQIVVSKEYLPSMLLEIQSFMNGEPQKSQYRKAEIQLENNRPEMETPYMAPTNKIQEKILSIWEEMLGIHPIGIQDDYFELGGQSLMAATMVFEIQKVFQKEIALSELFGNSTVEKLALLFE